MNYTEVPE